MNKLQSEAEDKNMEFYHYQIATKYIQTRLEKVHLTCIFTTSKLILTNQVALESSNKSYLHIYEMYKSHNRLLRYQTISNYKFYWLLFQEYLNRFL